MDCLSNLLWLGHLKVSVWLLTHVYTEKPRRGGSGDSEGQSEAKATWIVFATYG